MNVKFFLALALLAPTIADAQSTPRVYPKGQAYQLTVNGVVTETCFWKDVQRTLTQAAQQPGGITAARLIIMDAASPKAAECKASYEAYAARQRKR